MKACGRRPNFCRQGNTGCVVPCEPGDKTARSPRHPNASLAFPANRENFLLAQRELGERESNLNFKTTKFPTLFISAILTATPSRSRPIIVGRDAAVKCQSGSDRPDSAARCPTMNSYATLPQQFLYFLPLPQGHGSFRQPLVLNAEPEDRSKPPLLHRRRHLRQGPPLHRPVEADGRAMERPLLARQVRARAAGTAATWPENSRTPVSSKCSGTNNSRLHF